MKTKTTREISVLNPYTGKKIGAVQVSTRQEIVAAVKRARASFDQHRGMSAFARHKILRKVADLLAAQRNEFAESITQEMGKPIKNSRQEVDRALFVLTQSAEEALRITGGVYPCDVTAQESDKRCYTTRKPLGIIAAITPFNFPINIPSHKIAPALAAGNAVIFKPSGQSPLTAEKYVKLFQAAGLPAGMLQLLHGDKAEVEILCAQDVNMITFTGGTAAGHNVARVAGMKKLSLELGDNAALMVFDDADLDAAVAATVSHRFMMSGQRCTAAKRAFVQRKVYARFMKLLRQQVQKLKSGDPMDETVDIGPLISEKAAIQVEQYLKASVKRGAKIVLGGGRRGAIIEPTIVENAPEDSELACEEIFGPVLPVFPFDTADELISRLNAGKYGLQAGVFTNQLDLAKRLGRDLDVVTLVVNDGPGFRIESIPFGGMKQSGMGREGIAFAIAEMTQTVNLVF